MEGDTTSEDSFEFFDDGFEGVAEVVLAPGEADAKPAAAKKKRVKKTEAEVLLPTMGAWRVLFTEEQREELVEQNRYIGRLTLGGMSYVVAVPKNIAGYLMSHQYEAVKLAWKCSFADGCDRYATPRRAAGDDQPCTNLNPRSGCILAHQMGTGKTLTAITLLSLYHLALREHNFTTCNTEGAWIGHTMAIVPTTLIATWHTEWKRWMVNTGIAEALQGAENRTSSESTRHYGGLYSKRDAGRWARCGGVMVLSYSSVLFELLNTEKNPDRDQSLARAIKNLPKIVVFDEGHERLSSRDTKTRRYLEVQPWVARVILTGTPLSNNIKEYFSIIDFARPGFFKQDYAEILQKAIVSNSKTDNADSRKLSKQVAYLLTAMLRPFVDRRRCEGVFDSLQSTLHDYVITVPVTVRQFRLYCRVREWLKSKGNLYFTAIVLLQRLLHHPDLLLSASASDAENNFQPPATDSEPDDDEEDDVKTEAAAPQPQYDIVNSLQEYISDLPKDTDPDPATDDAWPEGSEKIQTDGKKFEVVRDIVSHHKLKSEKILIFSSWIAPIEMLSKYLTESIPNLTTVTAHGKVNRKKSFSCFANGEADVMLMTIQTGSAGLNLQNASVVIILDVPWNPAKMAQAICRAYRVGQKKPVYSYRLVAQGTLESKIAMLALTKQWITDQIIDSTTDTDAKFSHRYGLPFADVVDTSSINQPATTAEVATTLSLAHHHPLLKTLLQTHNTTAATFSDFFEPSIDLTEDEKKAILTSSHYTRRGDPYGEPLMPSQDVIIEEAAAKTIDKKTVPIPGQRKEKGGDEKESSKIAAPPPPPVVPVVVEQITSRIPASAPAPAVAPTTRVPARVRVPIVKQRVTGVPRLATFNNRAVVRLYEKEDLEAMDAMFAYDIAKMDLEDARDEVVKKRRVSSM